MEETKFENVMADFWQGRVSSVLMDEEIILVVVEKLARTRK